MKSLTYANGDSMPSLGLGTWKSQPGEVYQAVKTAIEIGYRHIDCAPVYGNEKEVGQAITECIESGTITREELWVTSKLWNNAHAREDVVPALQQTLQDLQLEYLDLYLIHWPVAFKKGVGMPASADQFVSLKDLPIAETWMGMEEAAAKGLTRHLGVSNFGIGRLEELKKTAIHAPEINQVESHPYLQQNELLRYCRNNNIHYTAYSPLGSYDRPDALKAKDEVKLLDDPVLAKIATDHNASTAQVLIAWAMQRETSVIPKSVNPARIKQNFEAQFITLYEAEMQTIAALDKNSRYVTGAFWVVEGGPYTLEDVWF